jgi:signal peptidase II
MKISKKAIVFSIILAFFVILDRFLKALCLKGVLNKPVPIFGDILSLHFTKNYYISFSIPFSGPVLTILISTIILILLFFLLKSFKKSEKKLLSSNQQCLLTILIIGAIINLTDRLKFGYVIDYFNLKWFTVFNVADIFISTSILLTLLTYGKPRNGKQHES